MLNIYLKASIQGRQKMKISASVQDVDMLQQFDTIITVMNNHKMHINKYVFALVCCFQPFCPHPVCQERTGEDRNDICWYPGGPPLSFFPWPVPDPDIDVMRCTKCKPSCSGHFMSLDNFIDRK